MRSIQSGSFSYFCKVNPDIEFGGFLDYSKSNLIEQLPDEFKVKTTSILNKNQHPIPNLFPFILKPDLGERGVNVELIRNIQEWESYPLEEQLILQDYIDWPFEFGVFYARNPRTQLAEIMSITGKEFLKFRADGQTSLRNFVQANPRVQHRQAYLKQKFHTIWDEILPKGTELLLEPIGNHNRGTRFFDASDLISPQLVETIGQIANGIQGFNYGRFDVKARSEEGLKKGEFLIMEVNGANSEPTHIYDSNFSLRDAYAEVKRHLDRQYELAKLQKRKHSPVQFYKAVIKRLLSF